MKEVNDQLLQNTAMGIFAVVLLMALIVFASWTKNYVEADRKNKEDRIKHLETGLAEIQDKFNDELYHILIKHESMMASMQATFGRMEKLWERIERKLDNKA